MRRPDSDGDSGRESGSQGIGAKMGDEFDDRAVACVDQVKIPPFKIADFQRRQPQRIVLWLSRQYGGIRDQLGGINATVGLDHTSVYVAWHLHVLSWLFSQMGHRR